MAMSDSDRGKEARSRGQGRVSTQTTRQCEQCNKKFTVRKADHRFCCLACRTAWWKAEFAAGRPHECSRCGKPHVLADEQ